jgi:cation:H+ antiporter
MVINIVLLVVGFIMLIKGADVFVEGASKIAEKFNIPQIVIGLTIVAFGTSAPEAAVSIASAYKGTAGIAVGNIFGSNICNVLLILGIAGTIGSLQVKENTYKYEIPFVFVITLLLGFLGINGELVSRIDGIILWCFFLIFMGYLYWLSKKGEETRLDDVPELEESDTFLKLALMIVLGIACIVIGSNVTVDSASAIASSFGVSDRIIGLTIVAIGTSLPELMTSVNASLKGKNDIAVGNIVGSNIFNILFVLGTSSIVSPNGIMFSMSFIFDFVIAIVALVMFVLFIDKNLRLRKVGAIIMWISYFAYIIYILR